MVSKQGTEKKSLQISQLRKFCVCIYIYIYNMLCISSIIVRSQIACKSISANERPILDELLREARWWFWPPNSSGGCPVAFSSLYKVENS